MAGTYSGYAGGPATGDNSSLPSAALWHQVDADKNRPGIWSETFEEFHNLPFTTLPTTEAAWPPTYKMFSSSGATFSAVDVEGGVREFVEATDNEGLSWGMASFPYKIIQGAGELVFECRIKRTNITATFGLFVGLLESAALSATVPIQASGAISDNNLVGFFQPEGDPDGVDTYYKANGVTAVTVGTDAFLLVADTYVKMGMIFNRRGDNRLEFTKDGLVLPDSKIIPAAAGTDFPNDVRLGAVIAVLNGATAALNVSVDWLRVAQRRIAATL